MPRRASRQLRARRRLLSGLLFGAAIFACLALVMVWIRPAPVRPSRPVTLMTGDWAPYAGQDLPGGGPIAQIITLTLRQQGFEPTVKFSSWQVAQSSALRGESMGLFPMVGSEARRRDFAFSDPITTFRYVLFYDHKRLASPPRDAAALQKLRVARIAGYDYWPELDAAVGDRYHEYLSSEDAFAALARGEVDLVPEGLLPGRAQLMRDAFPGDSARFDYLRDDAPLFTSTESLYLITPKNGDYAPLLPGFNAALASVKQSPDFARLMAPLEDSGTSSAVVLTPHDAGGLTRLRDEDGGVIGWTPRGTTGEVGDWPDGLARARRPDVEVTVKITSGPFRGRMALVDPRDLVIERGTR